MEPGADKRSALTKAALLVAGRLLGIFPGATQIAANMGWLFLDRLLRMGVGLLVSAWVARYLGPEQFGLMNFALAFTGLFAAFAGLGLQGIAVRDSVRDPEKAALTLGTTALLQLAGAALAYLAMIVAVSCLRPDDMLARSTIAVLGALLFVKAGEFTNYWFESQVQSRYIVWVQGVGFLVFAGLKVALIVLEAPFLAFVYAVLGEAAVVALCSLVVMDKRGHPLRKLRASMQRARMLLADCWPLMLAAVAVTAYMKIDQIMIGQMLGDHSVGLYSAAVRVTEIWFFIPMAVVASLFPSILQARDDHPEAYNLRLQRLYDLMALLGLCISLAVTLCSGLLVELMFGSEYAASARILSIHVWSAVFVFLGVASSQQLVAEHRQTLSLERTVLGMGLNIVLNFSLIPAHGPAGAAVASLLSQMSAAFFYDLIREETRPMFLMKARALNPARVLAALRGGRKP